MNAIAYLLNYYPNWLIRRYIRRICKLKTMTYKDWLFCKGLLMHKPLALPPTVFKILRRVEKTKGISYER